MSPRRKLLAKAWWCLMMMSKRYGLAYNPYRAHPTSNLNTSDAICRATSNYYFCLEGPCHFARRCLTATTIWTITSTKMASIRFSPSWLGSHYHVSSMLARMLASGPPLSKSTFHSQPYIPSRSTLKPSTVSLSLERSWAVWTLWIAVCRIEAQTCNCIASEMHQG